MLDSSIIKKVNDFVYTKPRTIDEVAKHIGKNWRTADRYVQKISEEQGALSIRVFREGTRGALKIVFWNNIEKIHSNSFQEKLFSKIERGLKKTDFSPFDIYQHVEDKKKSAQAYGDEKKTSEELALQIKNADKQILIFSGNLSWANSENGWKILEDLAKRNVSVKIITRVDYAGLDNIKRALSINEKVGRSIIDIRHKEQPLRGSVVDGKVLNLKEVKNPLDYKSGELKQETSIFYQISDKDWVEWMQKVFWNMFSTSIDAENRIKEIKKIGSIF